MKSCKSKLLLLAVSASICLIAGCTDAERGKFSALGEPAHIKCYSGSRLIFDGHSTGKVSSEKSSDGYFFKQRETGDFKEVSGNCDITYGE